MKLFFHKLRHWEYWPAWLIYFPVSIPWIYYSIRSGSFFFFNRVNPGIRNGGMMNVSKMEIYKLIPEHYYPKTYLVKFGESLEPHFREVEFTFPLFVKPDKGLRGTLVKKIESPIELIKYHDEATFDYLIQEEIPYPLEIGLFYIRMPNQSFGKISGIVEKILPEVAGNGYSNLRQLMKDDPRLEMQIEALQKEDPSRLNSIPAKDEKFLCSPYGNHCRGALFLDQSHRITEKMVLQLDAICSQIPGFFYGRLDIKFNSWEEFEAGQKFQIIELNGALSEPAHMYDPRHSYIKGQREIFRHIHCMYRICRHHQQNGIKALDWKEGIRELKNHYQTISNYKSNM
ncbi:MAG: D-alanine--D-alanine ligase [Saprospiraceae bacterium]|nr:D-alanine--D-alanine ligase [Saprospiraceae bacterium]